jgi:hypothetical protein
MAGTDWTVRGSNLGEGGFSAPAQTGPGVHPASYTMGAVPTSRGKNRHQITSHSEIPLYLLITHFTSLFFQIIIIIIIIE